MKEKKFEFNRKNNLKKYGVRSYKQLKTQKSALEKFFPSEKNQQQVIQQLPLKKVEDFNEEETTKQQYQIQISQETEEILKENSVILPKFSIFIQNPKQKTKLSTEQSSDGFTKATTLFNSNPRNSP
eukprot:TRINITY_DN13648_c0_g1_i2.p2 TRINITY_DN13648_c0_g1~~TRINITY_DN13648_c0_g1_i2.p2  ORF type:complete len:127 (-),score=30.07 TRINITY_DN13648_c0_g1_i2:133-513(-)